MGQVWPLHVAKLDFSLPCPHDLGPKQIMQHVATQFCHGPTPAHATNQQGAGRGLISFLVEARGLDGAAKDQATHRDLKNG